jgi:hypothetical protein
MNASDIKKKLVELNPGISFDAAENRPSDYQYVLQGAYNMTERRGGVFYNGRFICAMDRGVIREKEIWQMADGFEEIPMSMIDRVDESRVIYVEVMKTDPNYNHALLKAQRKDDNFQLDGDGKVFKYRAVREGRVRDKILTIGWRNTLTDLAFAGIPGVTVATINEKFDVSL